MSAHHTNTHRRRIINATGATRGIAIVAVALLASLFGGGCILGPIAQRVGLDPPNPAQYVPADDEPMLVMVETYQFPSMTARESETLARLVTNELTRYKVAPTIDPTRVHDLRTRDPAGFRAMSIAAIGRAVGARQVLYVNLTQHQIERTPGSNMIRGQMATTVKIVDATTGQSRWPTDTTQGVPVSYETPMPLTAEPANETLTREQLQRGMSQRIVRLFRKWKSDEVDAGRGE